MKFITSVWTSFPGFGRRPAASCANQVRQHPHPLAKCLLLLTDLLRKPLTHVHEKMLGLTLSVLLIKTTAIQARNDQMARFAV